MAFTSEYISNSLGPGKSVSFTLTPFDSSVTASQITAYSLTVQSMSVRANSATPTPMPATTAPTVITHPTTSSQPNSSPTNSSVAANTKTNNALDRPDICHSSRSAGCSCGRPCHNVDA